ncbi:probable disease resistance protein At4g27220 [Abrus precatorius]|uniref:Probable disease resistance protein At4g27220 n=1 Tax=Abrus precatorius TaxID=3816 RepID=A0A8B8MMK9_ABRPR|nr:probable disease resistance protein At4g27220 [Abrus precatorius]
MEDFILSIIAKIAEYAVAPILHHAKYLCCFNNFAGSLQNAKRELELTRDSVNEHVKEAINRNEKIEPTVEKWRKEVENVLEEVQKLEVRIYEANKSYFRRQCQYFLVKEIARTTEKMTQLNHNSKFEPFSRLTELPGMMYYSSKKFILFKSTESAYKKLLETLRDNDSWMIGLHGIGGSGKTTLVKEVGKKAEELNLFEKVVMVTVSQTPNIRSIQAQITDQLGFKLEEESDLGRAQRLSQRLRKGTTLLIMDDVWEKVDFEALGIPFNENRNGCRVLLTTRSTEVCTSMQCQSIIELSLLTDGEAWNLFKLYASIDDDSPNALKVVARKIVNECKGLPIAIVTVGSMLRGKTFEVWESALSRLEDSRPLDIPKGLINPYVSLQLSYDNLTNQLAKSLFLLCSIFPEDHEIDLEDLFRFGRGLGLTEKFRTMEKARREMHLAVNVLMDSCLLLHANKKERVKMHDMVRDVALWIASERDQAILASNVMDPRTMVEDETIKDKRAISLWELKNGQLLDDQLNCSTLEVLLLHSPNVSFKVSNVCLEGMKILKVLAFLTFGYKWNVYIPRITNTSTLTVSLPQSIESLKNLKTLCLRGYKLGDFSILESLQGLEILDLRGSSFEELPNGIVALKKLKLLDLFNCWIEKNNTFEVIARCLQLEELYLYLWKFEGNLPHNVSFSRLRRYAILQGKINIDYYEKFSDMQINILENHRPSRALCIEDFNASAQSFMSLSIKDLFVRADDLHLIRLQGGYKNLIPTMDQQGMNQLIFLILEHCSEIECLVDSTIIADTKNPQLNSLQTAAVFSSIVTLRLFHMHGLQEVFRDPALQCSLKNLEELRIENCKQLYSISFPRNSKLGNLKFLKIERCQMLTSLFMPSIAQTLELLEELKISKCSKLKHLIEVEEGNVDHVINQSHPTSVLSKLRILDIEGCESLEYIFPVFFARCLRRLEEMRIHNSAELKYVFGTEKEHRLLVHQNDNHPKTKIEINLPNFRRLSLNLLLNLIDIWPEYCHPCSPNVKTLEFNKCPKLSNSSVSKMVIGSHLQQDTTAMEKEILWVVVTNQLCDQMFPLDLKVVLGFKVLIFTHLRAEGIFQLQIREHGSNREQSPLNLDLYGFYLTNLPELKFIWKGPTKFLSLQVLKYFRVDGCPKLKTIFSPTIVRSLPELRSLKILNCDELEQIFDSGDAEELKSLYACSQQVCFPKLWYIEVQKCNKLKCLFYNLMAGHFPSLDYLEIKECSQLEKVFDFEHEADEEGQEGTNKDGEQPLLQNLRFIILKSLLNFKDIHHGFKLKHHVKRTIENCPKYSPRA